jgi:hypothetical protein
LLVPESCCCAGVTTPTNMGKGRSVSTLTRLTNLATIDEAWSRMVSTFRTTDDDDDRRMDDEDAVAFRPSL